MKCINFNNKHSGCCKADTGDSDANSCAISKLKSVAVRTGSFILICLPFSIFAATILNWYLKFNGWAVPIFSSILFLMSVVFFLLSCFTNPGIIPSRNSRYLQYDVFKGHSNLPFNYNMTSDDNYNMAGAYKDLHMSINGKLMKIKYCVTCNIFRSPRAVHCRICNVCVHRFDHHCKWLDNCIGYNNYKYFIAFIMSTFLLIIAILVLTVVRLVYIRTPPLLSGGSIAIFNNKAFITNIVFISLLLIMVVSSGWFVIGLFVYHFHLILTNQTTNEQLKGVFYSFNPHNRGFLMNLKEILFKRHIINYTSNVTNSIYNPVSEYEDVDNLSLIGKYLINKRNIEHGSSSSNINDKHDALCAIASESGSIESNTLSEINIVNNDATSMDFVDGLSHNFEDDGQSELSLSDVMNEYNNLKKDLNETKLFNQQVNEVIGNDEMGNNIALSHHIKQKRKILTRKNGIDIANNKLHCCKY